MTNPYRDLDDYCFWSRAMTAPAPGLIDPVVRSQIIAPAQKVATMGSCFAQHLARHIAAAGLNYFVAEQPPEGMSAADAKKKNYGVFSARYGNLYTVKQAIQLFDRAYGTFRPEEAVWLKGERFCNARRSFGKYETASAICARGLYTSRLVRVYFGTNGGLAI